MFRSKVQQKIVVDQCSNIGLKIPINDLLDFHYPVFAKDLTLRVPRKEINQFLLNLELQIFQKKKKKKKIGILSSSFQACISQTEHLQFSQNNYSLDIRHFKSSQWHVVSSKSLQTQL